jgi:hypothetical protein
LHDVCSRHLDIRRREDSEVLNVLEDMSCWVERLGGNPAAVRAAKRQLVVPSAPTRLVALVELLCWMLQQDSLRLSGINAPTDEAEGLSMPKPPGHNVVWVPWSINALLARRQAPRLHLGTVTNVLAEGGVLIDVPASNGRQAWPVSADWLQDAWSQWQRGASRVA